MNLLLAIAGGVALILFGVRFIRKGLDRLFGARLGRWMQKVAQSRWRAFLTGIGVAVAAPSSTTVSVLTVQTVHAGQMTSRQMLAVIFGANIGLTVLVLLGTLSIEDYNLVLVAAGVLLFQFTRGERTRGVGQFGLGLGFVLMGISVINAAASGVEPQGDVSQLIQIAQRHPWALVLLAALMAVLLQSSTATILLIIGLSAIETVELSSVIAAVVGANLGVTLTLLAIGWKGADARKLALANLLAKVAAAIVWLAGIGVAQWLLLQLPGSFELRVGYAHVAFNLTVAAIGLSLEGPMIRLLEGAVPRPAEAQRFGPRYIDTRAPDSVGLALGQSLREILRISEIAREMLDDLWRSLQHDDKAAAQAVSRRDDQIDLLDRAIKQFLTQLAGEDMNVPQAAEQMRQLRYLGELETIGDIIDKNLSELVIKKIRQGLRFSGEGASELNEFFEKVRQNMVLAEIAFQSRDQNLARQLLRKKEELNILQRQLRDRHLDRLNCGMAESHDTSAIHLDLLTHLKRINSCVSHIAYAVLDQSMESPANVQATPAAAAPPHSGPLPGTVPGPHAPGV